MPRFVYRFSSLLALMPEPGLKWTDTWGRMTLRCFCGRRIIAHTLCLGAHVQLFCCERRFIIYGAEKSVLRMGIEPPSSGRKQGQQADENYKSVGNKAKLHMNFLAQRSPLVRFWNEGLIGQQFMVLVRVRPQAM